MAASTDKCDGSSTQNSLTVTAKHGSVFYIDSGQGQSLDASYASYVVKNTAGASVKGVWVAIDSFTGGAISLASARDANMGLGDIGASASKTAFFLLKASNSSSAAQSHRVHVYTGKPGTSAATELYSCTFSFAKVAETIKAKANKVTSVANTTISTLGSTFKVTVVGATGTIGSGSAIDPGILWFSPVARSSWPTSSYRLETTSIGLFKDSQQKQQVGTNFIDTLRINWPDLNITDKSLYYTAEYTFRVLAPTSTATTIAPVAQIASGTQTKHNDVTAAGATGSIAISSPTLSVAVTKSVANTSTAANGKTTFSYTVSIANTGASSVSIDQVVDTPDSQLTYVASSAKFAGVAITEPSLSPTDSTKLVFAGPFAVPNGTTKTLTYQMSATTCVSGSYTYSNSVVANIGSVTVGSSATSYQSLAATGTCGSNTVGSSTTTTTLPIQVVTGSVDTITTTSATIYGSVYPSGDSGSAITFDYGTSSTLSGASSKTATPGTTSGGTSPISVSASLTSLAQGTKYYYRVRVGSVLGEILSFVTSEPTANPTSTTTTATNITDNGAAGVSALFNGQIDPNLTSTQYKFFYGVDSSNGSCTGFNTTYANYSTTGFMQDDSTTPATTIALQSTFPVDVTSVVASTGVSIVTGLTKGSYYCFDLVAFYGGGYSTTADGGWKSFRAAVQVGQTITFPQPADILVSTTQSMQAYSSSGLAIVYSSNTPDVCTISALGVVTGVTTGICSITADQPGNLDYTAAVPVSVTFNVFNPPSITNASLASGSVGSSYSDQLTATGGDGTYSNWTLSSGSLPAGVSLSSTTGALTGTPTTGGVYPVTFTVQSAGFTSAAKSLSISVSATVTFNANTGSGSLASQTATGATSLTLNNGSIYRANYNFSGWNTAAGGGGTSYSDGASYPFTTNQTLYAQWVYAPYAITYNGNGHSTGSVPSNTSGTGNVTLATNTGSLAKTSYYFNGWTIAGVDYQGGGTYNLTGNVTAYAKWSQYTITYSGNGNGGGSVPASTLGYGSTTVASNSGSLTKSGYFFDGWTIGGSSVAAGGSYSLTGDVTAYAKWSQYTITYSGNGNGGGSVPASTLGYGSTTVASNSGSLTKSGYFFDGWTIGGTSVAAGGSYSLTGDVTAYAKWSQYTITYDGNGNGAGSVPSATSGNGSVSLASNSGSLTKTGYYFDGWTIGGTSYSSGGSYNLTGSVTAYAKWSQYTITYSGNGNGGGSVPASTLGYGSTTVASNSGSLTKSGYFFDGWTIGGTSVAAGGSYSLTGDVTAYAKWSQYTISYDGNGNGGGSVPASTQGYGTTTVATNSGTLTKSGYYFDGWTIGGTSVAAGGSYSLTGDVTAYAKWSQYAITYDGNGYDGGLPPANTFGFGSTALEMNSGNLTKTGYDFAGWTINGTHYAEGQSYSLSADVTAYARWTLSAFRITYVDTQAASGRVPSPTGGQGIVSIAGSGTLSNPNHYFAGWLINGVTYAPYDSFDLQANTTATAVWAQYNLSYGDDFADGGLKPGDTVGFGLVTLSGNVNNLSRTGYYFDGWDINGTHYASGDSFDLQGLTHATPHWSQYTITYDTNGATQTLPSVSGFENTLLDDGLTLSKPDDVVGNTTTSYIFGGWIIGATNYNGGDTFDLQSDVTATAIWNAVVVTVYTVTYDGDKPDSGSVAPDTGVSVTLAGQGNLLKSGYTFGGWSWSGNTYHQGDTFSFPTNADVTFVAIWDPIVYTLTFTDGGAASGTVPDPLVSSGGSLIDFPSQGTLDHPGYTFDGWDINGVVHLPGEKVYLPSGNETAVAIWTPIVYHFVYDGNGSTGGTVPTGFDGYGSVTVVGNTGSLTNGLKIFGGWSINGITHLPGATVSLTSGDVTAYALWVDSVYTLTYQDDGSAESGSAPAAVTGYGTVELASDAGTLTWAHHHVDGWTIGGVLHPLGGQIDLTVSDLTATAHWALDQVTITYSNAGADTGVGPGSQTDDYASTVTLLAPGDLVKAGYEQTGWLIDGVAYSLLASGFLLDHDTTADPIWTPIVYTVTFDCTDGTSGTCPSSLDSTAGSEVILPNQGDLERYGYTFGGWLVGGVVRTEGEHYVPGGDETATPIWNPVIFKVHYVGNGNTGGAAPAEASSVAFAGVSLATKGTLARNGYTFGGWLIAGTLYAAGDSYVPLTGDVTASAVWNPIIYTVTYLGNGNTGGSLPAQGVSTALSAVVLAAKGTLVRNGYSFGGWTISGTTFAAGASYTPGSNVNATAVWNPIVYTLTYLGNGNDGGTVPANGISTAFSAIVIASPGALAKSGYTFGGWSIGGTVYQPGTSLIPGANITATAVWNLSGAKSITYTNTGASSGTAPAQTIGNGNVSLAINSGRLARAGFTFGGWQINGVNYAPGATYNLVTNVTASPVWTAIVYTITFDGNGNDAGTAPAAINGYGRVVLSQNSGALTRFGFTFAGWTVGGSNLAPGSSYLLTAGNVTAKAVWNPIVYSLSFTANGGSGQVPSAILGFGPIAVPSAGNLVRVGYTFGGWILGGTTYAPGSTFNLTGGSAVLQAVWTPIVYTLTFSLNGGTGVTPASISGFGVRTLPNALAFTRTAYTFAGWSDGGALYGPGDRYSLTNGNRELVASWTPIIYTITYVSRDADAGNPPAADSGFGTKTIASASSLSRYGYTFAGWRIGAIHYQPGSQFELTGGDVTAAPIWQKISYTITYSTPDATSGSIAGVSGFGNTKLSSGAGLVRTGYRLTGWAIGTLVLPLGATYALTGGNVTATAIWERLEYNLSFDSNGADGTAPSAIAGFGPIMLPGAGKMSLQGYTFGGWQVGGTAYNAGDTLLLSNGDVTAYAQWNPIVFVVSFAIPNATSGDAPDPIKGWGDIVLPRASGFKRLGFDFAGWRIGDTVYQPGQSVSVRRGDVTARATWQTQIVYKEFSGFAPGSPLLTADIKAQITTWIKANPGYTVADCVGYTMGPTVLAVDKALATNRAQYACSFVGNTFPKLFATGKWGGNDLVVGDPIRRVRITLHN